MQPTPHHKSLELPPSFKGLNDVQSVFGETKTGALYTMDSSGPLSVDHFQKKQTQSRAEPGQASTACLESLKSYYKFK